jgi:hypothetical protein
VNLLCLLFGHMPPQYARRKGWGGWEYCDLGTPCTDNIGRQHVEIFGDCARCERRFQVGKTHLPTQEPRRD